MWFPSPHNSLLQGIVLYHAVSSFALVGLWQAAYALFLSQPIFQSQAIVVGVAWAGHTIVQAIRESLASGYQLVVFIVR